MWARRVLGPIAAALALGFQWLLKLKFLIFAAAKFSFVTTALTMVVSVGAYTLLWGWPFAALFVLLLFVHESGMPCGCARRAFLRACQCSSRSSAP